MMDSDGKILNFLRLQTGLAAGAEVSLTAALIDQKRPVFIIGADPRCDLQLNDSQVAPAHAAVVYKEGQFFIRPQFPKLSVLVNNKPIKGDTALKQGDSIQIGETHLGFGQERDSAETPRQQASNERTLEQSQQPHPVELVMSQLAEANLTVSDVVSLAVGAAVLPPDERKKQDYSAKVAEKSIYIPPSMASKQVYYPRSAETQKQTNPLGILFGLITVVALVGMSSFGALQGLFTGPAQTQLNVAYQDGNATMVMFTASWCQYCAQQKPIIGGLKDEYRGDLYVEYVDIDSSANRSLVSQYGAYSIPLTVIFNDEGQVSSTFRGVTDPQTLRQAINDALRESASSPNVVAN